MSRKRLLKSALAGGPDAQSLSRRGLLAAVGGASASACAPRTASAAPLPGESYIADDGLIHVGPFSLPPSSLLSAPSQRLFVAQARLWEAINASSAARRARSATATQLREAYSDALGATLQKQQLRYPSRIAEERIGGVRILRVRPAGGSVDPRHLLVSLHGGGFSLGAGAAELIEAIPIATAARMEVVSIDYRMAPEHSHPAGLDDVEVVFEALAQERLASSIGLFGSSSGALLAAQFVSRRIAAGAPKPGALGMFALGAAPAGGDSFSIVAAIDRVRPTGGRRGGYLSNVAEGDATAFPAGSPERLADFPPSLLVSSVRDLGLSSVVRTHTALTALDVQAELHVWEGLRHCFYYDPDFEESQQMYRVAGGFFRRILKG